ncbi:MAG: AI-2E family transporter [Gemmatimonadales bacterium]|jgi:predicted PurR-regulated permease PerM|nr:MAG: AI-2E family transporter [Gemmatimonadales bacterium]
MANVNSRQVRAAILILALGIGILVALAPFTSGLLAAPVFYVVFHPLYQWFTRRLKPALAAGLTIFVAVLLIIVPGSWLVTMIVEQAQDAISHLVNNALLTKLQSLTIAGYAVGPELVKWGQGVVGGLGRGAFAAVGTVTLMGFNLAIAFFVLYFMLVTEGRAWLTIRPYIPFSIESAELLRERFRAVTISTVIGTGVTATIQGVLVGLAFIVTGLPNAVFWGVVTVVFAILPVVGSGLVWIPAAFVLLVDGSPWSAFGMAAFGALIVGNIDNVIRPIVFRRWAQTHPLIVVLGAFAGVRYLGLLGLLIGPLALSYFFELVRMYNAEYVDLSGVSVAPPSPPV